MLFKIEVKNTLLLLFIFILNLIKIIIIKHKTEFDIIIFIKTMKFHDILNIISNNYLVLLFEIIMK